jgi:hypothetical protein
MSRSERKRVVIIGSSFAGLDPLNQWLYVLLGACPASIVLRRTCRLRSAIYPNPTDNREPASAPTAREEVTV